MDPKWGKYGQKWWQKSSKMSSPITTILAVNFYIVVNNRPFKSALEIRIILFFPKFYGLGSAFPISFSKTNVTISFSGIHHPLTIIFMIQIPGYINWKLKMSRG